MRKELKLMKTLTKLNKWKNIGNILEIRFFIQERYCIGLQIAVTGVTSGQVTKIERREKRDDNNNRFSRQ